MVCSVCGSDKYYAKLLCRKCYRKEWYSKNRETELTKYRERYSANKIEENAQSRKWYKEHPGYYKEYYHSANLASKLRARYSSDPHYKLKCVIRARLYSAINNKNAKTFDLLGCSVSDFKQYLESKFELDMTWDNWSKTGWNIDHIEPLCKFDLTDPEQLKKACHYTNLQPLWVEDHIIKTKKDIQHGK